jgi:hypothetical protein
MKEITINKNGKETIIKCQSPKGRDTKKGFKMLMRAQGSEDEKEAVIMMEEYLDFLDEITAKYSGLTIDELDDLESQEKDKLSLYYQECIGAKIDFLASSLRRAN